MAKIILPDNWRFIAGLTEAVNVDPILNKICSMMSELGSNCTKDDVRALFVGGDSKGMRKLLKDAKLAGYDDGATSYDENKSFWGSAGVTKADYDKLVKASK